MIQLKGFLALISLYNNIWNYRYLLLNFIVKELKIKYKHSVLGFFWSLLNPLLSLIIYTMVFKTIMRVQIPHFPIFLLCGLLPWTLFQLSVMGSANSLIVNGSLLKKVYFAREIIPLSVIGANLVNFLMTMIILFGAEIFFGIHMGWALVAFPGVLVLQLVFITGFSLLLSVLTAKYRDIAHLMEVVLNAWFYATPIVYPLAMVPHHYSKFILSNPVTWFVGMYRDILLNNHYPTLFEWLVCAVVSVVLLIIGVRVFRKFEYEILERI